MEHRHLRRTYLPDSIYFVTTNLAQRSDIFLNTSAAIMLEETIWFVRRIHRCVLYAYVIMPDHLHMLIQPTLTTISSIMHSAKKNSSRAINNEYHSGGLQTAAMQRKYCRWQKGFYDHVIKDDRDFLNHVEYIKANPVKAGLVERPEDYPFLFVDSDAVSRVLGL